MVHDSFSSEKTPELHLSDVGTPLRTHLRDRSPLFTNHTLSLHSAHLRRQVEMLECRLYKVLAHYCLLIPYTGEENRNSFVSTTRVVERLHNYGLLLVSVVSTISHTHVYQVERSQQCLLQSSSARASTTVCSWGMMVAHILPTRPAMPPTISPCPRTQDCKSYLC
jgi:hypothetical protein